LDPFWQQVKKKMFLVFIFTNKKMDDDNKNNNNNNNNKPQLGLVLENLTSAIGIHIFIMIAMYFSFSDMEYFKPTTFGRHPLLWTFVLPFILNIILVHVFGVHI
jgi:hypothetical protein